MKKLVITLLCFGSALAIADTVAITKNKNGGAIVLTDVQTSNCASFAGQAYSTGNSNTLWGCWISDDLMVHVRWNDGDTRSYPIANFEVNIENARRLRERNSRGGGTGV